MAARELEHQTANKNALVGLDHNKLVSRSLWIADKVGGTSSLWFGGVMKVWNFQQQQVMLEVFGMGGSRSGWIVYDETTHHLKVRSHLIAICITC